MPESPQRREAFAAGLAELWSRWPARDQGRDDVIRALRTEAVNVV